MKSFKVFSGATWLFSYVLRPSPVNKHEALTPVGLNHEHIHIKQFWEVSNSTLPRYLHPPFCLIFPAWIVFLSLLLLSLVRLSSGTSSHSIIAPLLSLVKESFLLNMKR